MLCFGVVLYVLRLRPVLHFVRRRTSCALCFDDAVCFSLAIAIWFAATSCFAPIAKKYAAVGETFCLLCFSWLLAWLCSPSPLEEEVLASPCLFLFLSRRKSTERTQEDRDPGYCVHSRCAFRLLLLLVLKAQQSKKKSRFARFLLLAL